MTALHQLAKIALVPLLAASLGAATTYTVKSGDTLSSIARRNSTSIDKLMTINDIKDPSKLFVGQTLKLSSAASTKPAPKKSAPKATKTSGSYTIQAGDTFYSISKKNGISVDSLKALNPNVNPSSISVGQTLILSGKLKASPTPSKPKAEKKTEPIKIAVKVNEPNPQVAPKPKPSPTPKPQLQVTVSEPATEKKEEDQHVPVPSHVSSVMIDKEISYGAIASRYRTTTKQLNALNGWSFKPTTIFARGSEIYVPGNN